MRRALDAGLGFGLSSGVITTLGLLVGLHSGTRSTLAVVGGVVTIAVADALSDALGMHIAEESRGVPPGEVWVASAVTFAAKFIVALTFLVPVLFLELDDAVLASVAWGLTVIAVLSYRMARREGASPWKAIAEHVGIALVVVGATHWVGEQVARLFAS